MVLNTPMNVSENIGVAVGAKDFLTKNATQIQSYWDSWNKDGGTGNRDGVFDPGEGFALTNLADIEMDRNKSIRTMNNLSLARFNPLAMSSNAMPGMVMTKITQPMFHSQQASNLRSTSTSFGKIHRLA